MDPKMDPKMDSSSSISSSASLSPWLTKFSNARSTIPSNLKSIADQRERSGKAKKRLGGETKEFRQRNR